MNVVNHVFTIILVIKIHVQHWAWIYIVSFLNIKRYHLILFCLDLNSVWYVFDAINETDKQIISCGLHSQDNWTVSGWNVTVTRHRTVDICIYISTDCCKHHPHTFSQIIIRVQATTAYIWYIPFYNLNMWSLVRSLLFPRT